MSGELRLSKLRRALWLASILVFTASLMCPTYCTSAGCDGVGGGFVDLISGWLGALVAGGVYLVWFANPFFLVAILTNKNSPGVSIGMSIIALVIGLTFLRGGEVLLNEAGHTAFITGYHIGYWLWLASFLLMLVAAILSVRLPKNIIEHHVDS